MKTINIKDFKQILNKKPSIIKSQQIKVHFIGVGGISMNSLAIYLLNKGFIVSGSDINSSKITDNLVKKGLIFYKSHNKNNIINKDIIVYSNAVEESNEFKFAIKTNKLVISRAQLLSLILKKYKTSICVSGAHGKTTTTAMIYSILEKANKKPNLHLGGNLIGLNKSYNYTNSTDYIVCEACEYKDSFLELKPDIGIILNIAPEHLDYFKNYENVKKSFVKFGKKCKQLITESSCRITGEKVVSYGFNFGYFTAKNIKINNNGNYSFDCYKLGKFYYSFNLKTVGKHNILNALASIAVADKLEIKKEIIKNSLSEFKGVERRYEYLSNKTFIVADYAHHPDEIKAVINETKKFYKNKLLIVFQPHTYSRTKKLMTEFIKTFLNVDNLVILKTYSAREKYDKLGSALTLSKQLKNSIYISNKNKAINYIKQKILNGYGVLFLGAGNIYELAKIIVKKC